MVKKCRVILILNQIYVREHVHEFKFKFRAGRAGVVNGLK
jgi:hypothetical protein